MIVAGGQSCRDGRTQRASAHNSATLSTAKLRTVKLTLVVVMSYVVCYGPFFVAQMWAAWDVHAPFEGTYTRSLPIPPLRSRPLKSSYGGLRERCKLSQQGLGRSASRNRSRCILALKDDIWWQQ